VLGSVNSLHLLRMFATPKKKYPASPFPNVDSPSSEGWGRDDPRRRSRVLAVLASHYRRYGVRGAHKLRSRNHPDITEDELEDYVDQELAAGGSRFASYINKSSGRILAHDFYGQGRNPIDERNSVAVVAGPAAIERHGLGDGEPINIQGTVSLPKNEDTEAAELKNYDTPLLQNPNGKWDDNMHLMNNIPYGAFNGMHIGNTVRIKGFEARFIIKNVVGNSGTTLQAPYGWGGTGGLVGDDRTIPPIEIGVNAWQSYFADSGGGTPLTFWNATLAPIAAPPGTIGTMSCLATGPAPGVPPGVPVPFAGTDLATVAGPAAAITLQPQQLNVANHQAFPALPAWTTNPITTYTSYKNGRVSAFRVLVLYDKYGNDAKNVLTPSGPPTWYDLMELNGALCAPATSLYSIPALERFLVCYDAVHEPDMVNDFLSVVIPPKCVDLESIYNTGVTPISSGCLYFICGPLELYQLLDPAPYVTEGVFRVFYEDHCSVYKYPCFTCKSRSHV